LLFFFEYFIALPFYRNYSIDNMALIEAGHPALSGNDRQFWQDQLNNSRILLHELDVAILMLERQEIESYTIDTGQINQTVRRVNLPELMKQRAALIKQIQDISATLDNIDNSGGSFIQVVPF
jgi:hypothetical protein